MTLEERNKRNEEGRRKAGMSYSVRYPESSGSVQELRMVTEEVELPFASLSTCEAAGG